MSRRPQKIPSYTLHKASGQGLVRLDGVDHYLGRFGSEESYEKYERAIAEWRTRKAEQTAAARLPNQPADISLLTVNELILRYLQFAQTYYSKAGQPTKELADMKYALRPVRKLYGRSLVREFGPLALKAVRQHMIDVEDLSRGVINNRINRVKRVFKWAVSEELAPAGAYEALRAVVGLRYGRTTARETEPVKPVHQQWVEATLPYLSPQVATMVQVQLLCGMRPCEVTMMRACDIEMTGEVWVYEPEDHKNRWRGHQRLIPIGPRAQALLKPFLTLDTTAYLFSPRAAEEIRNAQRRRERKTPMTPSQRKRQRKVTPKRAKRDRYDVCSYRRAITYGIQAANKQRPEDQPIPNWSPLQLRHSRATEIRKQHGIEAAQVYLGHARADVTQVYAERNLEHAVRIARESG